MLPPNALPDDIDALKAALIVAQAEAAAARAQLSADQALIAHLKLQIEKLNRERFGQRSERTARLIDQLELQLEELEASATEDELAAERAAAKTTTVAAFTRKRPSRKPFPEHLPRERVIEPAPTACLCCGSERLRKLGEDVTETLEVIPRRPGEVHLPGLREDQPGAGAVPRDPARLGRPQLVGDDPVREVRAASAAEPAG
jgi:transposase